MAAIPLYLNVVNFLTSKSGTSCASWCGTAAHTESCQTSKIIMYIQASRPTSQFPENTEARWTHWLPLWRQLSKQICGKFYKSKDPVSSINKWLRKKLKGLMGRLKRHQTNAMSASYLDPDLNNSNTQRHLGDN